MEELLERRLVVPQASLAAGVLLVRVERPVQEALAVRPLAAQQEPQVILGAEAQQGSQVILGAGVQQGSQVILGAEAQQGSQVILGAEAQQGSLVILGAEAPKPVGPGELPAQQVRPVQEVSQVQAGLEPLQAMAVQAWEASQGLRVQVALPEVLAASLVLRGLLGLEVEQVVSPAPEEQGAQLLLVPPTSSVWSA